MYIKFYRVIGRNPRRRHSMLRGNLPIEKKLVETIPSGKTYSLERGFFPGLIGKGLYGYRCEAQFLDIGTPESLSQADEFLSKV